MNFLLRSRLFQDWCIGLHFYRVISGCRNHLPPLIKIVVNQNHAPDVRRDAKYSESTPKNLNNTARSRNSILHLSMKRQLRYYEWVIAKAMHSSVNAWISTSDRNINLSFVMWNKYYSCQLNQLSIVIWNKLLI